MHFQTYRRIFSAIAGLAVVAMTGTAAVAAEFPPEQIEFFEKSVRPVLAENCYECHSAKTHKVGLRLDSRDRVLRGSDYHKVINLEKPEESPLLLVVRHEGAKLKLENMPKDGAKLSDKAIADLTQWVKMGLPWPEEAVDLTESKDPKDHWSYQPIQNPAPPQVKETGKLRNEIDRFVLAKLESQNLTFAPEADRRTLARRVYYDLTGLPPTYEEVERFAADKDPQAYEKLVDELLRSPHYGERWGRHWLDVARYSDTKGYEAGGRERRFIYAYTFRDWVIRSLNEDMPYDKFVLYQLAADHLVKEDSPERAHLAAMGFLTVGRRENTFEDIDDRLDVTFRGLMATTVACARCHDHKTDPVPTMDYYSLAGVFLNSEEPEEFPVVAEPADTPEYRAYLEKLAEKQKVVDDFLEPKLAVVAKENPNIANRRFQLISKLERPDRRQYENLQKVVDKFIADSRMEPDKALVLRDKESLRPLRVFIRGNPSRQGDVAPRRFLSIVAGENAPEFKEGSGRLEMAQAIVDRNNPLTSRTIVNRVWGYHFGKGIVGSPSDFGLMGDLPTHPELLDYLSTWFMDNGWSLKKLHRLIMTSAAYRQASVHPEADRYTQVDPANHFIWKMNRQRLEFEAMRDTLLLTSGQLNQDIFGRSVKLDARNEPPRRTLYAYIDRQNLDPVFNTFDFASPARHTPERPYTTIPTQALYMMNSPFVVDQARLLVARDEIQTLKDPKERVKTLYRLALSREPTADEADMALQFVSSQNDPVLEANRQTITQWQYGWGDFDPEFGTVNFRPFTRFIKDHWQPATAYPDRETFGYLALHAGGGHPDNAEAHNTVVRWTAPDDMVVNLSGVLRKPKAEGDGVRARIYSVSKGLILEKVAEPGKEASTVLKGVSVKRGETLDFVVDCMANNSHDSYTWEPEVTNAADDSQYWNYGEDYSGPGRLATPWENLAQALFCTNEFMFVD